MSCGHPAFMLEHSPEYAVYNQCLETNAGYRFLVPLQGVCRKCLCSPSFFTGAPINLPWLAIEAHLKVAEHIFAANEEVHWESVERHHKCPPFSGPVPVHDLVKLGEAIESVTLALSMHPERVRDPRRQVLLLRMQLAFRRALIHKVEMDIFIKDCNPNDKPTLMLLKEAEDLPDDDCAFLICYEDFGTSKHKEGMCTLPCGHIFGERCIQVHFTENSPTCPMCKRKYDVKDYEMVLKFVETPWWLELLNTSSETALSWKG
ncbi:hypothetical protein B0J14DRAFT_558522 [Halenospora varia]|nr:hypothetical protein B0J14DRAFT_558522 [Halenospora varia]